MADDVHRGHRKPGAIGENADIAVELDEFEAGAEAVALQARSSSLRPPKAASSLWRKAAASSMRQFAVERNDAAIGKNGERIDLDELGIDGFGGLIKSDKDLGDLRFGAIEVEAGDQSVCCIGIETFVEIDEMTTQCLGLGRRDLFDIHAALESKRERAVAGSPCR